MRLSIELSNAPSTGFRGSRFAKMRNSIRGMASYVQLEYRRLDDVPCRERCSSRARSAGIDSPDAGIAELARVPIQSIVVADSEPANDSRQGNPGRHRQDEREILQGGKQNVCFVYGLGRRR